MLAACTRGLEAEASEVEVWFPGDSASLVTRIAHGDGTVA